MVADDVYMYVRMCLRIYKCVCATRVLVSSLPGNVRQRVRPVSASVRPQHPSNVRHKRFSSVRRCVRRVTGGCYRFWQEKDYGEKEEKQEEKKQEGK